MAACTGASSRRAAGPSVAPAASGSWPARRRDSCSSGASSMRMRQRSHNTLASAITRVTTSTVVITSR
jgi:hypothetical protein